MKSKTLRCHGYRLSPNEEARIFQEETERLRKLRIVQVRELSKKNAAVIRQSVKAEKHKQLQKLAKKVKEELDNVKEEKIRSLESRYDNCIRTIGTGHREAGEQEDTTELREEIVYENSKKADLRYKKALESFRLEKELKEADENYTVLSRKIALDAEKERSHEVASRPPPPPDPTLLLGKTTHKPIKMTDSSAFSLTHYHMPQDVAVERADPDLQTDARESAKDEAERIEHEQSRVERSVQECQERARVRHVIARDKELLKQDYEHMLHDLSDLQRADMNRRQKQVANIPKQVFQPPHRRLEDRIDKQHTMEQAFEDMYLKATDYVGDISLALDPYAPMDSPVATSNLELSVLSDHETTLDQSNHQNQQPHPHIEKSEILKDVTNIAKDTAPNSPKKSVLKKLFSQIKNQREEWLARSSHEGLDNDPDLKSVSPDPSRREIGDKKHIQGHTSPNKPSSPPGRDTNDSDARVRPTENKVSSRASHEERVKHAIRELQEIQEKKERLEAKLREYSVDQKSGEVITRNTLEGDKIDKPYIRSGFTVKPASYSDERTPFESVDHGTIASNVAQIPKQFVGSVAKPSAPILKQSYKSFDSDKPQVSPNSETDGSRSELPASQSFSNIRSQALQQFGLTGTQGTSQDPYGTRLSQNTGRFETAALQAPQSTSQAHQPYGIATSQTAQPYGITSQAPQSTSQTAQPYGITTSHPGQPYGMTTSHAPQSTSQTGQPYGITSQAPQPYRTTSQAPQSTSQAAQPYGITTSQAPQPYGMTTSQTGQPYGMTTSQTGQPYGTSISQSSQRYQASYPGQPYVTASQASQPYGTSISPSYGTSQMSAPSVTNLAYSMVDSKVSGSDPQDIRPSERISPNHAAKIKEYQQKLLERHQNWKLLAETRSEIERRRRELKGKYPQLNLPQLNSVSSTLISSTIPSGLIPPRGSQSLSGFSHPTSQSSGTIAPLGTSSSRFSVPHPSSFDQTAQTAAALASLPSYGPSGAIATLSSGVQISSTMLQDQPGALPIKLSGETVPRTTLSSVSAVSERPLNLVPGASVPGQTSSTVPNQTISDRVLAGNIPPATTETEANHDNIRKQLIFETPMSSPQKEKPPSPLGQPGRLGNVVSQPGGLGNVAQPASAVSNVISHAGVTDPSVPVAVPLGFSRERKAFKDSPQDQSETSVSSSALSSDNPIAVLTTAAEQRKQYFEKRQKQLSQQLEDIQRQKEQYLTQHEITQQTVKENRQRMLRDIIQGMPKDDLSQSLNVEGLRGVGLDDNSSVLPQNDHIQDTSIRSESSLGKRSWADILNESSTAPNEDIVDGQPQGLNVSASPEVGFRYPRDLSTILEVDTPQQNGRKSSEFESSKNKFERPGAAEDIQTGDTYEPMMSGFTIRKDQSPSQQFASLQRGPASLSAIDEAQEALERAQKVLYETVGLSHTSPESQKLVEEVSKALSANGLESVSDFLSAISGSQSQNSTELSSSGHNVSPHVSQLTQYPFSDRSQPSQSYNEIPSSNQEALRRLAWMADQDQKSPSGLSGLTQYSASSASGSPIDGATSRQSGNREKSELTQYSIYSDSQSLANQNGQARSHDSDYGISLLRPKSAESLPGSELTQYTIHSDSQSRTNLGSVSATNGFDNGSSLQRPKSAESLPGSELTQYTIHSDSQSRTNLGSLSATNGFDNGSSLQRPKSAESLPGSELTQYTMNSDNQSRTNFGGISATGGSGYEISFPRPKSADSLLGSELTQYTISPTISQTDPQNDTNTQPALDTYNTLMSNGMKGRERIVHPFSSTGAGSLEYQTPTGFVDIDHRPSDLLMSGNDLKRYKSQTERRAAAPQDATVPQKDPTLDIDEYSAMWRRESGQSFHPLSDTSFTHVSYLTDFGTSNFNNSNVQLPSQFNAAQQRGTVHDQISDNATKDSCSPDDMCFEKPVNSSDIFRAVKVFIEPPKKENPSQSRTQPRQSNTSQSIAEGTVPSNRSLDPVDSSASDNSNWFVNSPEQNSSVDSELQKWKEHLQLGTPTKDHHDDDDDDDDTGITEEPDLTFVSLATLSSPSKCYNDSQSDSLMSFEKHEQSVGEVTPRAVWSREENNDAVIFANQETRKKGTSLQEAFLAKRRDFVQSSEDRVLKAKQKSKSQPSVPNLGKMIGTKAQPVASDLGKTVAAWKQSRGNKGTVSSKISHNKSPSVHKTKSTPERKKDEKDKVERTKRLYNQLEEVKEKNLIDERQKQYAANRVKAKEYHQKMQEKLKKQRSSRK